MKPLLICFDWDGTLADSMDVCVIQIQKAIERMGLPERKLEQIRSCNGPTYGESVKILGIPEELGAKFLQKRKEAEMEILKDEQKLFPNVKEMLENLQSKAKIVIVSNGLREYIEESMKITGVSTYFDGIESLIEGRSKEKALKKVLDQYPEYRAVMIGDRLGDIMAGKENNIPTIAACYGYGNPDEYNQADIQVDSVRKLSEVLLNMISE